MALEPFQIIANPNAASGKGRRVVSRLEAELVALEGRASLQVTHGPGHARELARQASEGGITRILVAGGDGTVHEVANGLLDAGRDPMPALAILPVGTGNDFFRMVRSPGGVEGALRTLKEGTPRLLDVGEVCWSGDRRCFVNLVGVGVDVEVLRRRAGFRRLRGLPQYLAALGLAFLHYRCLPLTVEADSDAGFGQASARVQQPKVRIQGEILLAAATVGPSVGGGFLLAPGASSDDGLLDLFVVKRLTLLKVARYLPRVLRGTLEDGPEVHTGQVSGLRIRSSDDRPFSFELDGELMPTTTTELEIRVRPACLPVLEFGQDSD